MCAACAPDLYPLLSRIFPGLFSTNSYSRSNYPAGTRPNRVGYGQSNSRAISNNMVSRNAGADNFDMDDMEWRKDKMNHTEVRVKGGISDSGGESIRTGSQDAINVPVENHKGIVKTTHFIVEDDGPKGDERNRWSNV